MAEPRAQTSAAIDLVPPLDGYYISRAERVAYLPVVMSRAPGQGHVGRLIDRLVADHDVVVVPCVLDLRLVGMLQQRGLHRETHFVAYLDSPDPDTWVWRRQERMESGGA